MTEAWKHWEGQVVNGKFPLRQYLGGSDHSAVFLTEFAAPEPRKAAIKLIPEDSQNAELQLARYELAAKLPHPRLIRIFQTGQCPLDGMGLLYVLMEYAEENLAQILPDRPLTPAEAREMLKSVLDALAFLHNKGFVHGRLKPANILAIQDQVRISIDDLYSVGELRLARGKPGVYDPPEAASGRASTAGDIWSLGMILVEALTQRVPVWQGTRQGEPLLPNTLPEPFLDLARHCLRRNPQRRWTVAEIAARLQLTSPAPLKQPARRQLSRPWTPLLQTLNLPLPPLRTSLKVSLAALQSIGKRRYLLPSAAIALALAAILVAPKLLTQQPQAQQASSPAPEPATKPAIQPAPKSASVPVPAPASLPSVPPPKESPATPHSAQKSSESAQTSAAAAPPPAALSPAAPPQSPAPASARGAVAQQVLPDVPQKARDTIQGTVRVSVKVQVSPSGIVVSAEFDSPGPSKYFADLSLKAARRWQFVSPTVDGQNLPSAWLLRFHFTKSETTVQPHQFAP